MLLHPRGHLALPTTRGAHSPATHNNATSVCPFPTSFLPHLPLPRVHKAEAVHVSRRQWARPLPGTPITGGPPAGSKASSHTPASSTELELQLIHSISRPSLLLPGSSERIQQDGHRGRRLRVLLPAQDPPPHQEEEAVPDCGDEGEDRLRRLREEGQEGPRRHERRELGGGGGEAEQGDGDGVRGRGQGDAARRLQDRQAGGAVALRAVRDGGAPLRARGIRQARPRRVRPQRHRRPLRRAARQGVLHRDTLHRRLQRREPQRMLRHVTMMVCTSPAGGRAGRPATLMDLSR